MCERMEKFSASLRVIHGGKFVTKGWKTEYMGGAMYMKLDMREVCYFNLVDLVKNELGYEGESELWFRRHGLSLIVGKKKIESDKDVELLMDTKDINGFVTMYVVHRESEEILSHQNVKRGPTENTINRSIENPTPTFAASLTTTHKTPHSRLPLSATRPQKLQTFRSKIPEIPLNNPEIDEIVTESGGGVGDEDSDEDSVDPDVVLSDGDFDDVENDDDLYAEFVEEDTSGFGIFRLRGDEEDIDEANENEVDDADLELEDELISEDDELDSKHGSDDDEVKTYPIFNADKDFKKPINLTLGLKFPSNKIFRKALRWSAIENGYEYYLLHNGSQRVSAYCKHRCNCKWLKRKAKLDSKNCKCEISKKCTFKVHAKKCTEEETFQIRSLRLTHRCGWRDTNCMCTSSYLAEKYLDYWKLDSSVTVATFQKKVLSDLRVDIGYFKAYYAKEKALKMIYGKADEQYKFVWDYAETLLKHDQGSSVFVQLGNIQTPPPVFKRMYMCLRGCKEGFINGCRPILGVDGCHLKGVYPGILLTAVGKDGNCNIYPLAWAVVEVENTNSWTWFLELLMNDIEPVANSITFISDRQKGLVEAFNKVVPNAEIRYCCRHIWTNFKRTYPCEDFRQTFWRIAKAYTKPEFDQHMEVMKGMTVGAFNYLSSIPTKHWCRHAFGTICKSAMMLNNCAESFNNVIRKCRDKPIIELMEWLRRYNMRRMCSKREGASTLGDDIMPAIVKQLDVIYTEARKCEIARSDTFKFEVEYNLERFVVDLQKKSCDCRKWDVTGVPCVHAFAAILKKRQEPKDFVDRAYSKEVYKLTYAPSISPMPGPKLWEKSLHPQPNPPPYRKMPGRPNSKKRRKEQGENEQRVYVKRKPHKKTCGNCGQSGHNRKGCKNPTVVKLVAKKRTSQEEVILTQNHPQSSQSTIVASSTPTRAAPSTTPTTQASLM
ncbi:uncharacterized protein LOC141629194 [Silene latifolia]|uniref:uncharacterized protein LOC141629194 n=1 Tax=Silene latifolia TaxID=37657 RepID=UPI003D77B1E8